MFLASPVDITGPRDGEAAYPIRNLLQWLITVLAALGQPMQAHIVSNIVGFMIQEAHNEQLGTDESSPATVSPAQDW